MERHGPMVRAVAMRVLSNPLNALEWAKQASVPDKGRDQWIADGLRVWGEQDPVAAERWREQEKFKGFNP